jgi:hypothetical protein
MISAEDVSKITKKNFDSKISYKLQEVISNEILKIDENGGDKLYMYEKCFCNFCHPKTFLDYFKMHCKKQKDWVISGNNSNYTEVLLTHLPSISNFMCFLRKNGYKVQKINDSKNYIYRDKLYISSYILITWD